jgi:hypothetical protein
MDWSMRIVLVAVTVALMPLLYLLVAVHYSKWLHERGVAEPEKQAALLVRASMPSRRPKEDYRLRS